MSAPNPHIVMVPHDLVERLRAAPHDALNRHELLSVVLSACPRPLEVGDRVRSAPHGVFPLERPGAPWEIIAIADGHALLRGSIETHVAPAASRRENVYAHARLSVLERVDA